ESPHADVGNRRTVPRVFTVGRTKRGPTGRGVCRQLHERAKALVLASVVEGNDEALVRKLRLKMKGRAAKRTYERCPAGAVGMNGPDAPVQIGAKPLVFQRAEHDAPILENHRVQGAGDVEVADHFHVAAVVIHDKQLEGDVEAHVIAMRHLKAVAVAGEHDLAARQRTGAQIANRIRLGGFTSLGRAVVPGPRGSTGVRGELLTGQADNLPGLDVDLVDVGRRSTITGSILQPLKEDVVDPLATEGN